MISLYSFGCLLLLTNLTHRVEIFKNIVKKQLSCQIKIFHSDSGGEFTIGDFTYFLNQYGTKRWVSCPHTPQQNGVMENKHRHVVEIRLSMLSYASLSTKF
jgi:transposase InsO family protein